MVNSTTVSSSDSAVILVLYGLCQNDSLITCVTVTSTCFILIVVGIILNLLVCHVMLKSKRYMKSISCFMIIHLGVVEIIYRVAITPPLVFLSLPSSGSQSSIPCKASYFISSTCRAAIFASLVVIAIDRYRNIVHPLDSLKRSKRPTRLVLLVWIYSVISSAMFMYTATQVPLNLLPEGKISNQDDNITSCDVIQDFVGAISVTVSVVMTFIVPLVTMIMAYSAVFLSLRHRCRSGLVNKAAAKSKAKAAKMLVLVVSGFVICWAPGITMTTIRSYGGLDSTPIDLLVGVSISVNLFLLCSSLVNPVIYTFYSAGFKNDIIKIFRCHRSKVPCSGENKTVSQDTAF